MTDKFRLVTRSDFDGLACAVILKHLGILDEILFVHPKDMQDGKVAVTARDITTNVPYVPGVHLAFDHHLSETLRVGDKPANHIIDPKAESAARVVYDHFGGKAKLGDAIQEDMMAAVDKADAARFSRQEILEPEGWVLLNYLMDPRTGLGRFREFRISNYQLMMELIDACLTKRIDEILNLPDVKERIDLYDEHEPKAIEQIKRCSKVHGKVVVLDLRSEETIWPTNRFMIYALFPECTVSIHQMWGLKKQNTVLATGKSILDRSSQANIGALMLAHGGGGHAAAGTCQVENDAADEVLRGIVDEINAAG
jgi:nanoRNase/pAp phosphatase (c-di-AMP/oligoRNAs hydrolase)